MVKVSYNPTKVRQGDMNAPHKAWNMIEYAKQHDGNYATCKVTGNKGRKPTPSTLYFSGFNCNIPEGSIITECDIKINLHQGYDNEPIDVNIKDSYIYLPGKVWHIDSAYGANINTYNNPNFDWHWIFSHDENSNLLKKTKTSAWNNPEWKLGVSFTPNSLNNSGYVYFDSVEVIFTYTPPANVSISSGSKIDAESNVNIYNSVIPVNTPDGEYMVSDGETTYAFPTYDNPFIAQVGENFDYKVYFRAVNGISNKIQEVHLNIPPDLYVVKANSTGAYDYDNNIWYPRPTLKEVTTLTLTLKSYTVGHKQLSATLPNVRTTTPYQVYVNPFKPEAYKAEEVKMDTMPIEYGKPNTNFFIGITGLLDGESLHNYKFKVYGEDGKELKDYPLDFDKVYIESSVTTNINGAYKNQSDKQQLTIHSVDTSKNFYAFLTVSLTIYDKALENSIITVECESVASGKKWTFSVPILPNVPMELPAVGTTYLWDTDKIVIGTDESERITLWAKGSEYRYMPSDLTMTFEKPFGYIGCVKMSRSHMKPQNNTTNTLLEQQYMNRVNMGKKGDYKEVISMDIRIPPQDVVVLQGLARMDKPVPIDIIPNWWQGDPLNHRGWAELYEVKGINKVNDMLYECKPTVRYLTRGIDTKFTVTRKDKVCGLEIPYILQTTYDKYNKLTDFMNVTTIPDRMNGYYTYDIDTTNDSEQEIYRNHLVLDSNERILLQSKRPLAVDTNIKFNWLNRLVGNNNIEHKNWKMCLRLFKDTDMRNPVFEYLYYDFVHLDNEDNIVNKCNVMAYVIDNGVKYPLSFNNMYLDWDNNEKPTEDGTTDTKILASDVSISKDNRYLTCILTDNAGNVLQNKTVHFNLKKVSNETTKDYPVTTDDKGVAKLKINLENDNYSCIFKYEGSSVFNASSKEIKFNVNIRRTHVVMQYNTATFQNALGYESTAELYDEDGNSLKGQTIWFKYTDNATKKSAIYAKETNADGKATCPIYLKNGKYTVNYIFKGTNLFEPISLTSQFTVKLENGKDLGNSNYVETTFTSRNTTMFREKGQYYEIRITDKNYNPFPNSYVVFQVCNTTFDKYVEYTVLTDSDGVARLQINLNNGIYFIQSMFFPKSDNKYLPCVTNEYIDVQLEPTINTQLHCKSNYYLSSSEYIRVKLSSEDSGTSVPNKKINFWLRAVDSKGNVIQNQYKDGKVYTATTDSDGYAKLYISLNNGIYRADVSFDGDLEYTKSDCIITITMARPETELGTTALKLPDVTTISTTPYVYTVTLTDASGNPIIEKPVSLVFTLLKDGNGTVVNKSETRVVTTNSEGKAGLDINYYEGTYSVHGIFYGDTSYAPADTPVKTFVINKDNRLDTKITTNDNTISDKNTTWSIALTDGSNNPLTNKLIYLSKQLASDENSEKLQFNKLYTDSRGIIDVKFGALTGTYNIWASFNGDMTYKPSASKSKITFNIPTDEKQDSTNTVITPSPQTTGRAMTIQVWNNLTVHSITDTMSIRVIYNDTQLPVIGAVIKWTIYSKSSDKYLAIGSVTTDNLGIAEIPVNNSSLKFDGSSYYAIYNMGDTYYTDAIDLSCTARSDFVLNSNTTITTVPTDGWTTDSKIDNSDNSQNIDNSKKVVIINQKTDYNYNDTIQYKVVDGSNNVVANTPTSWLITTSDDGVWGGGQTSTGSDGIVTTNFTDCKGGKTYIFSAWVGGDTTNAVEFTFNLKNNNILNMAESGYVTANDGVTLTNLASNVNVTDLNDTVKTNSYSSADLEYGSLININIRYNKLSLVDYGLMSDAGLSGGKIILNDIDLPKGNYVFEIEEDYDRDSGVPSLPTLITDVGLELSENTDTTSKNAEYDNLMFSPSVVSNRELYFSRRCAEGLLYAYKYNDTPVSYIGNPYNQYKGGCNLETYEGVNLMDVESGVNPICINNMLIKVAFHKLLGFVEIFRYDYIHRSYVKVRTLRVGGDTVLNIEYYDDDKISVKFGDTLWTVWRGHPFVEIKHPKNDIELYDTVDTVWCELEQQNGELGVPYASNVYNGAFNTSYSRNLFYRSLKLNEPTELDNFNVYQKYVDTDSGYYTKAVYSNPDRQNKSELRLTKPAKGLFRVRFPDPHMIPKPADAFTLFVDYVYENCNQTLDLQLNCYGKDGRKTVDGDYGVQDCGQIYTQNRTITPVKSGDVYEYQIRESFEIPSKLSDDIKFIDFTISAVEGSDIMELDLSDFMLYVGTSKDVEFIADEESDYDNYSAVYFNKNFYCNMYDENKSYGLSIIRPNMDSITLSSLPKSDCTVLAPYMKSAVLQDRPDKVAIEYMNFYNQEIDIIRG